MEPDIKPKIKSDQGYKAAMDMAIRLLCRRRHTSYEIEQKLVSKDVDKDYVKAVISECKRLNYINDKETAYQYFKELKARGCGCMKIRLDMKRKGITQDQIEDIFSEYYNDSDEIETARKVLQKKMPQFSREKDPKKKREKIYRFLSYRGFTGSIISKLLNEPD